MPQRTPIIVPDVGGLTVVSILEIDARDFPVSLLRLHCCPDRGPPRIVRPPLVNHGLRHLRRCAFRRQQRRSFRIAQRCGVGLRVLILNMNCPAVVLRVEERKRRFADFGINTVVNPKKGTLGYVRSLKFTSLCELTLTLKVCTLIWTKEARTIGRMIGVIHLFLAMHGLTTRRSNYVWLMRFGRGHAYQVMVDGVVELGWSGISCHARSLPRFLKRQTQHGMWQSTL